MSSLPINQQLAVSKVTSSYANAASQGTMTSEETQAFSQALAKEMAILQGAQAGTSAAGEGNALSAYTPALMSATTGQGLESQLLMLLMTMTTGQADVSSIMSVLSQAVASMQDASKKEKLRRNIMDSSYDNDLLDQVSEVVFQGSTTAYPYEAWKACAPTITNSPNDRTSRAYTAVIDQFGVESNARYANNKRGNNDTYCNIFIWDVTSAMQAEIPHYIDATTGEPRTYPNTKGARELNANATQEWLLTYGKQYGWVEVSEEVAQAHANSGSPAVTSWRNQSGGSGHVQVIRPERAGVAYDAAKGVAVAQAGSKLTNYTHANDIFSERAMGQLKYFIHK